jgi:hypothetical protein
MFEMFTKDAVYIAKTVEGLRETMNRQSQKPKHQSGVKLDLNTIIRDWHEVVYWGGKVGRVGPSDLGSNSEEIGRDLSITNKIVVDAALAASKHAPIIRLHIRAVCNSGDVSFGGVEGWEDFAADVLVRASESYKSVGWSKL